MLDGPNVDPLKLTLVLAGTGADGNAIEQDLLDVRMPLESADRDVLIATVSLADTHASVGALTAALVHAIEQHRSVARPTVAAASYRVDPVPAMSPRQAFFAPATTTIAFGDAVDHVSAELIAPYPPGIPVVAPGERITREVLDALEHARATGIRIAYATDPTLQTVRVIATPSR